MTLVPACGFHNGFNCGTIFHYHGIVGQFLDTFIHELAKMYVVYDKGCFNHALVTTVAPHHVSVVVKE